MSNTAESRLRVFLCHASQDKTEVRRFYRKLQKDGVLPWLDEEDLLPGQDWKTEIQRAVRASDAVIVFISPTSSSKIGFVQKEIKFALDIADERPPEISFLFPVLLQDCPIPDRFSAIHVARLWQPKGYDLLFTALKIHATALGRVVASPTPPSPRQDFALRPGIQPRTEIINACYRDSFHECFRTGLPLRRRSKKRFTVSLIGRAGVGKTALAYVLTGAKMNFLGTKHPVGAPYAYRLTLKPNTYLVDHSIPGGDKSQEVLDYLRETSDLAICLHNPSGNHSFPDLNIVRACGLPVAVGLTKSDLLNDKTLISTISKTKTYYDQTPLPLATSENLGVDELRRWLDDAERFYD